MFVSHTFTVKNLSTVLVELQDILRKAILDEKRLPREYHHSRVPKNVNFQEECESHPAQEITTLMILDDLWLDDFDEQNFPEFSHFFFVWVM